MHLYIYACLYVHVCMRTYVQLVCMYELYVFMCMCTCVVYVGTIRIRTYTYPEVVYARYACIPPDWLEVCLVNFGPAAGPTVLSRRKKGTNSDHTKKLVTLKPVFFYKPFRPSRRICIRWYIICMHMYMCVYICERTTVAWRFHLGNALYIY